MGLLFVLPTTEQEVDRIDVESDSITLKSYGLPLIFWGYLLAILSVIFIMYIAVRGPLNKLIQMQDTINQVLGYTVYATLILIPLVLLIAFFYEKKLTKTKNQLIIKHCFFWTIFYKKIIELKGNDSFVITHFSASPNVAKIQGDPNLRAFQTQGYHEIYAELVDGTHKFLDRHARKADLEKIKVLLSKY
jgi:hypothetical protein